MNTLISQNEPQLRFPEFLSGWYAKKLGDLVSFSKGKGISKSDIDDNGKSECIRYGELYTTYNELIDNVVSKTNLSIETLVTSHKGDVIILHQVSLRLILLEHLVL